jgi:hypothetical protein
MIDPKEPLTDPIRHLGPAIDGLAEGLQSRAQDAWNGVREQTTHVVRGTVACVRGNLFSTVLMAFALGVVLGVLLGRRAPVSFKALPDPAPLRRSGGLRLALFMAIVSVLRRTFSFSFTLARLLVRKGRKLHLARSGSRMEPLHYRPARSS